MGLGRAGQVQMATYALSRLQVIPGSDLSKVQ